MTSTAVDEYWLVQDDAHDLRSAVAVIRRRSRRPRCLKVRVVIRILEATAKWLESQV